MTTLRVNACDHGHHANQVPLGGSFSWYHGKWTFDSHYLFTNWFTRSNRFVCAGGGGTPYVKEVKVFCGDDHDGQLRVALYEGGTDDTDPTDATLVADIGQTAGTAINQWITITGLNIALVPGEKYWLCYRSDFGFKVGASNTPADGEWDFTDFGSVYNSGSKRETTAWGAVHPGKSIFSNAYIYTIAVKLEATTNIYLNVHESEHGVYSDDVLTEERVYASAAGCYHDLDDNGGVAIEAVVTLATLESCDHLQYVTSPNGDSDILLNGLYLDDCYHDHVTDAPLIIVNLSVENCSNWHFVDDPLILTVNLIVAFTYHAHASPEIPLTVHLVIEECYHEHDGEGGFLLILKLPLAEPNHFHYSDNIVLEHIIVTDLVIPDAYHLFNTEYPNESIDLIVTPQVQEAYHLHDADTLGLIAWLNIAEALHLHDGEGIELAQHFLTVQDVSHETFSDNISVGLPLIVEEANHDLIDDGALSLSSIYILANLDLYHEHAADNIDLSMVFAMTVAGAYHEHYIDAIAITQLHRLRMELPEGHAYHLHTADNIEYAALRLQDVTRNMVLTINRWVPERAA